MKWSEARAAAERRLPFLLRQIEVLKSRHGDPGRITLTVYPDEHTYRLHHPTEPIDHIGHRLMNQALQRLAKRHGYEVEIVEAQSSTN